MTSKDTDDILRNLRSYRSKIRASVPSKKIKDIKSKVDKIKADKHNASVDLCSTYIQQIEKYQKRLESELSKIRRRQRIEEGYKRGEDIL